MLILDLNYLEDISEKNAMYLHGGRKAQAISAWSAAAFGQASIVITSAKNQVIISNSSSSASSSVVAIASGDESAFATAYSFASVSS
ncbi:hypothetical protein F7734_15120 [Scytonema sp. UIC 10036]|uniref:hypothetical protein n=1 Tax=Scytonema sp. UIC 10036 TaxID=2304196 RepID=UPI0012DAAA2D|nr:hypothetical protein [Scytonema sp. UIC 10036]MUG93678.1 hypothetical protein [Scytonema sp. UIC 10036]